MAAKVIGIRYKKIGTANCDDCQWAYEGGPLPSKQKATAHATETGHSVIQRSIEATLYENRRYTSE